MGFFMIVLSKKRITLILEIVVVALFVFTFQIADTNRTVETVALPVSNKVIVVDAGHRKAR